MTDIGGALGEGLERLKQLPALLVVPALVTLLSVGDLSTVLERRAVGGHVGVEFTFPVPIDDLAGRSEQHREPDDAVQTY
ncbi:hypothetical protein [Halorhabdus amylolytica]|uniref:hypothetical protein n=1 Tax=Halorhabdus amylolytica TaxID=2559573 RepID=UPI0010AB4421|nr:hypothetical protein [Halorhabdus amylolytica]